MLSLWPGWNPHAPFPEPAARLFFQTELQLPEPGSSISFNQPPEDLRRGRRRPCGVEKNVLCKVQVHHGSNPRSTRDACTPVSAFMFAPSHIQAGRGLWRAWGFPRYFWESAAHKNSSVEWIVIIQRKQQTSPVTRSRTYPNVNLSVRFGHLDCFFFHFVVGGPSDHPRCRIRSVRGVWNRNLFPRIPCFQGYARISSRRVISP